MTNLSLRQIRWFAWLLLLVLLSVTYLLSASGKVQVNVEALQLFAPLPAVMGSPDNPVTDTKVTLGRILCYDPRLSANQKISCNRCHPLDAYGAESKSVSGFKNQQGSATRQPCTTPPGILCSFGTAGRPRLRSRPKVPSLTPLRWRCLPMQRPWN